MAKGLTRTILIAVAALAGCAQPIPPAPPEWGWLEQVWTITAAWPVGGQSPSAGQPHGQYFLGHLGTVMADGQTCSASSIISRDIPLAEALGGSAEANPLDRTVPTVAFQCAGREMASFARVAPDRLLTRAADWVLELRPQSPIKVPPPLPPPPRALVPPPPLSSAPVPVVPNASNGGNTQIFYVATYGRTEQALNGFYALAARVPGLMQTTPIFQPQDMTRESHVVRLYIRVPNANLAQQICHDLKALVPGSCEP